MFIYGGSNPSDDQHEESVKRTIVPIASSRSLLVDELEKRTGRSDRSINGLGGKEGETYTRIRKCAIDE
jgi:hypothetical protein